MLVLCSFVHHICVLTFECVFRVIPVSFLFSHQFLIDFGSPEICGQA